MSLPKNMVSCRFLPIQMEDILTFISRFLVKICHKFCVFVVTLIIISSFPKYLRSVQSVKSV